MKKYLLVILILLLSCTALWANPLSSVPGVVSYSENLSVYFNNEANATSWMLTQTDFTSKQEANSATRRIMTTVLDSIMPNFSDIVRMGSDFFVMVVRSSEGGESLMALFVQGSMTRLWQY
jgi:hypothetical protein